MISIHIRKHFAVLLISFFFVSCATYRTKYSDDREAVDVETIKDVAHTFYLIGDAGLSPMGGMNDALKIFRDKLDTADKNSTAIFLGDNIYPAGLPDAKDSTAAYRNAKNDLDAQLKTLKNFKGKPIFIPGNHDWYTEGLVGLKREQKYIQKYLDDKDTFLPEDGCPIETVEVNDDLAIIVIDTEWYLTNWDKRPDINDKCDIKSRDQFLLELEDKIKDNRERTTIIAMHHPMFSYGPHGGQYSFKKSLYPKGGIGPLPVLGTFLNVLRRTSGGSIADIQNKRYTDLKQRLITLAQYSDKVILASGHEHTLQYIVEQNTPQIVSGSGAKKGATRLLNGSKFSTGHMGYATLEVYTDGSSRVRFYGVEEGSENEEFLYTSQVLPPDRGVDDNSYETGFPQKVLSAIYTKEEIEKGKFFKTLWGERYRKYYGTEVSAPTVNLDTLFGGLKPVKMGGGHQSKSLRLRHKSGKEYVMRAMRKVSELYLQSMVFQKQYVMDDLKDTYVQKFLLDFYTGSHPYAPLAIGPLSDAVGLYHTNPVLYYIPKQPALEDFNKNFGDALYMVEEHTGDGHHLASFGYSDKLEGTDNMLEDLRDDEKYEIDSKLYLRARLFDMVIGDWDRHVDQWRWAKFKDEDSNKIIYRPVPRDRDQAFSIMGDGLVMNIASRAIPALRLMEGFGDEIRNVRGFNSSPKTYVLDVALLNELTKEEWSEQAEYLKNNLGSKDVDKAFELFPEEVRDGTVDEIKRVLLSRLQTIRETALEYYGIINTYAVVTGTDKDDWFDIEYTDEFVDVKAYRIIDGDKVKLFFSRKFEPDATKEIWIYGLDDDDHFVVKGSRSGKIKVRLIGGQNNDIYEVGEGKGTYVYDYKSKKNTFDDVSKAKVVLTDDYDVNTYRPKQFRASVNQMIPTIGFNPDDGVKIGVNNTYTYNGFRQNPFTQQHTIDASFYFATTGIELGYSGEFANLFGNWNLELAGRFTSPNFSINFFDFGNNTENQDDELDLDFNRVRIQTIKANPAVVWRSELGSKFRTGISFEAVNVEETDGRFVDTFYDSNGEENRKAFFGIDGEYSYSNSDNPAFPTMGMATAIQFGYKSEVDGDGSFAYIIPSLSFDYKLVPTGRLVLASKWKAQFNIGNTYEFYQAASIGGVNGLRGFRNQRFTGKKSFYQNTDIRYSLKKIRTQLIPMTLGFYGGFDYGRVWTPEENSGVWHTAYGGGFFLNAADVLSARLALFASKDGPRLMAGVGFGF